MSLFIPVKINFILLRAYLASKNDFHCFSRLFGFWKINVTTFEVIYLPKNYFIIFWVYSHSSLFTFVKIISLLFELIHIPKNWFHSFASLFDLHSFSSLFGIWKINFTIFQATGIYLPKIISLFFELWSFTFQRINFILFRADLGS